MSDIADNAQKFEQMERDAALRNRTQPDETSQLIVDGQVLCVDCEEPIDQRRLKYIVNASRCQQCQADFETREATV